MKIINYVLILSIFFITISCMQKNTFDEKKQVVVTGKVHQYNGENAKLYFNYSQPGVKHSRELLEIDSAGNFEYRIKGYIPLDAMILERNTFANINFIYHPGDSIHLEFEPNTKQISLLKTVKFSGDGAKTNNQLINFQILREVNNLGYGAINPTESYKKPPVDFILEMNSVKEQQLNIYKKFIEDYSPTKEAKNWAGLFALETYFHFLDDYGYEQKNLPDNYYNYNKEILPLTFDKLICWKILARRINRYHSTIVKPKMIQHFASQMEAIKAGTINVDSLMINFIYNNTSNSLLMQLSIANYYTTQFSANIISGYEKNQELINTKLDYSFIQEPLQVKYQNVFDFLNKPNDLTGVLLKKMENTPINETFIKILEENKGKVVLLDCWAAWCGPCKKAMADSKKLMKKFEEKDVSFVYVCIESEEKIWKRLLSEFQLDGGQHYLMNREQSKFFRDILKVDGVPCYFLINKKGKLIEQGNHLHPGETLTEEKITRLLKGS